MHLLEHNSRGQHWKHELHACNQEVVFFFSLSNHSDCLAAHLDIFNFLHTSDSESKSD